MSKQEVLKNIILTHYSMTCLALPGLSWKHSTASRANYMHSISFPMRFLTTVLRSDRGKPNPCITEETRELMKSRNYWRKRARRTDNPADWSTYKNLKHQVRKLIRAAESEFVKDQIQNNPRNTNCFWKAIRLCLPKRTFLHQSENLRILKLNLWLKSTTSFFVKTLLLLNVFLLVSNLHLIILIVNKSRMS